MVYKTRYHVFSTGLTTEVDLTLFTADDEVRLERLIIELYATPNGADTGGVGYEFVIATQPRATDVIAAPSPSADGDYGIIPEQEIYRHAGFFDSNAADQWAGKDVIYRDIKTKRRLQAVDKLSLVHKASLASKVIFSGIITMIWSDLP